MTFLKKLLIVTFILFTYLAVASTNINSYQKNIQQNLQVYLQNQTFPSEYLNSFRDYVYKVNTVASFSIEEDAEFAQISRTQMTYTEDGKLSSTSNYCQHVGEVLILYSRYLYDYVDD